MYLEIISPEATIFSGEVSSVSVPGIEGSFQMLNNHAPIVSSLKKGTVIIKGGITLNATQKAFFTQNNGETLLEINSGTVEMNHNKLNLLID